MTTTEPARNADELPATPLPCPFCDSDSPEFVSTGGGPPPMQAVMCGMCGARGPSGRGWERGDIAGAQRAAVVEWNRAPRPQPKEPPPEVIEAWARECRCCPCCRQCPCPGVMAGGMCDDFACAHEERDMDADNEEDDDAW